MQPHARDLEAVQNYAIYLAFAGSNFRACCHSFRRARLRIITCLWVRSASNTRFFDCIYTYSEISTNQDSRIYVSTDSPTKIGKKFSGSLRFLFLPNYLVWSWDPSTIYFIRGTRWTAAVSFVVSFFVMMFIREWVACSPSWSSRRQMSWLFNLSFGLPARGGIEVVFLAMMWICRVSKNVILFVKFSGYCRQALRFRDLIDWT